MPQDCPQLAGQDEQGSSHLTGQDNATSQDASQLDKSTDQDNSPPQNHSAALSQDGPDLAGQESTKTSHGCLPSDSHNQEQERKRSRGTDQPQAEGEVEEKEEGLRDGPASPKENSIEARRKLVVCPGLGVPCQCPQALLVTAGPQVHLVGVGHPVGCWP